MVSFCCSKGSQPPKPLTAATVLVIDVQGQQRGEGIRTVLPTLYSKAPSSLARFRFAARVGNTACCQNMSASSGSCEEEGLGHVQKSTRRLSAERGVRAAGGDSGGVRGGVQRWRDPAGEPETEPEVEDRPGSLTCSNISSSLSGSHCSSLSVRSSAEDSLGLDSFSQDEFPREAFRIERKFDKSFKQICSKCKQSAQICQLGNRSLIKMSHITVHEVHEVSEDIFLK